MTTPASITDYIEAIQLRGRPRTARSVALVLGRLHRWLLASTHVSDPAQATTTHLQHYQRFLANDYRCADGSPLARSTIATQVAVMRGWYRWLMRMGRILVNPATPLIATYTRSRVVVRQPLALQEVTALIQTQASIVTTAHPGSVPQAQALRNLAAICLGLATGRRIAGMTTLRVDDLNIPHRELRIDREKGIAGRVVPVAGWAVDVVAIYLRDARPRLLRDEAASWLFVDRDGAGPMTVQGFGYLLRQLVRHTIQANPDLDELPGKRVTWHSLRVSFATMLFHNGCDIRSVNELMLHRCLSTTALYTPIPVDDLRRVFRTAHPRP